MTPPPHSPRPAAYAYWIKTHVTAVPPYGGMRLPRAMGAVVPPVCGFQTPLSGQVSPVRAVVPIGFFMDILSETRQDRRAVRMNPYELVCQEKSFRFRTTMTIQPSSLGARLRAYRMKKKFSLQQLADEIGASKAHVWDLEQGNTKNPSLDLLTKLSRALDVSIKDLVGESSETSEDEVQLAPLFRELRGLTPDQLELIRTMTEKLREMGDDKKPGGGSK